MVMPETGCKDWSKAQLICAMDNQGTCKIQDSRFRKNVKAA